MTYLYLIILSLLQNAGFHPGFSNYEEKIGRSSFEMVAIPGGSFTMGNNGSGIEDEQPAHEVTIGSFWMAKYEVTWSLYEEWLNDKSDAYHSQVQSLGIDVDGITGASVPYIDLSFGMGKDDHPATSMTQFAAISFCKWMSAKTGHFYRLPTEAEWEYACRMGENPPGMWSSENSGEKYHVVGTKEGNGLGIHDMLGNVAEWTMDQYSTTYYDESPKNDPWLKPTKLYPRVLRGGSWKNQSSDCTCTKRTPSNPNWKRMDPQLPKSLWWHTNAPFVGIRVVRPLKTPKPEVIKSYWLEPIDDFN